jgi:hypothetical protein
VDEVEPHPDVEFPKLPMVTSMSPRAGLGLGAELPDHPFGGVDAVNGDARRTKPDGDAGHADAQIERRAGAGEEAYRRGEVDGAARRRPEAGASTSSRGARRWLRGRASEARSGSM